MINSISPRSHPYFLGCIPWYTHTTRPDTLKVVVVEVVVVVTCRGAL